MKPFVTVLQRRLLKASALTLIALFVAALPAVAQHGLSLSSEADFSTLNREFSDRETIYIRVEPGANFDLVSITESSFRLQPAREGDAFEGTLSAQADGSFTGSVEVSALEGESAGWHLRVKIEDEFDNEYEARAAVLILGRVDRGDDDDDDDDDRDDDRPEMEVEGLISQLTDSTVTVDGTEFLVTADTEIEGHLRSRIELSDLTTGLYVEVEGVMSGDLAIAQEIEVESEVRHQAVLRGEITALGDLTITIGDTEIRVVDETQIFGERHASLTFEDLEVGMSAMVHVLEDADGSLTAIRIQVKRSFERDDVEITGRIEAVAATEITVGGHTFSITEHTEIENQSGEAIGIADLAVGMLIKVEGKILESGVWEATEIKVRARLHQEGRVSGLVTAVGESLLAVNGIEFGVTDDTVLRGAASLADVEVGLRSKVWFRRLGDGTLLALRVHVHQQTDLETGVTGAIESLVGDTLVVAGIDVTIGVATVILDENNNSVTSADLQVGQTVEVEGIPAPTGGIFATKIKIEDGVVVAGAVRTQSGQTLQVAGVSFALNEETLIIGRDNSLLTIDDLQAGAYVEVIAAPSEESQTDESTMTADRVLVMESSSTPTLTDEPALPAAFTLDQNYPNPFNPSTNITFEIGRSAAGNVSLVVYDLLGRQVATLVNAALPAGSHTYQWNGRDDAGRLAASGVYLYSLIVEGREMAARTMILTK